MPPARSGFAVRTPLAAMVALGTDFTVDRLADAAELRVFEGRVRLDMTGDESRTVPAGHWALVTPQGLPLGRFDPAGRDDWQSHWLDADDMRLDVAMERLSRYSLQPIRISDPRLSARRFSGRLRLDTSRETVELICNLFNLVPVPRGGAIYLEPDAHA